MMLWMRITKQTKIILTGNGFSKLATNVSTIAQIADNATTKANDNTPNC